MAFPDNIENFLQAQDPESTEDVNNIKAYQQMVDNGDISAARDFLMNLSNGIQMSLSAGRYNQVIDAIKEIEEFYLGLNGVKEYIKNNASAYTNFKQWNSGFTYSVGNIVFYNGNWYSCITENTNVNPTNSYYWEVILETQLAKQYPVSETQPTGQEVGDLWFQVIE